jgi:hypothetical protein
MDYAPRVKLTIAKYLLPNGRSIHRELDEDDNIVSEGGVQPDHEIAMEPIERWQFQEIRKIEKQVLEYVDQHWGTHHELFSHLAVNDGKDSQLYPDFDAFFAGLGTTLAKDDVRQSIRAEIRRRVQDDRGAAFPRGDFVEDVQLQRAIQVAFEKLGEQVQDVTEYGLVFDFEELARPPGHEVAILTTPRSRELDRARALIQDARDGKV